MNTQMSILAVALSISLSSMAGASGYAESVYGEYAASSGGKVALEITSVGGGALSKIAGREFSTLISTPSRVLVGQDDGYTVSKHVFEVANAGQLADLSGRAEDFEAVGFPLQTGTFRLLEVVMSVGSDVSVHSSIEFCWEKQSHCVILDPSIQFLDSTANNHFSLKAAGNVPLIETEIAVPTRAGTCGLASNHGTKSKVVNYAARTLTWKNVFGNLLVKKNLGASQHGLSCDVNCKPKPYGYSNPSSAEGRLGWRTACDHAYGQGISGTTAKSTGITGCSDKYAVAAKFDATVNGTGANVNVEVDAGGSVHNNGGFVYDSCGVF